MSKKNKKEPLKETKDYPDFVREMVRKRIASDNAKKRDERTLYLAQDLEDHLLTNRISIRNLKPGDISRITKELREDT